MAKTIIPISSDNNILTPQEQQLVASKEMIRYFGQNEDFIQLYVYNTINTLLYNNPNFQNYSVTDNKTINFDPEFDIDQAGFQLGTYNMVYNFLRPILTLDPNLNLFIYNISPDRTEIQIRTTLDQDIFYSNAASYIDLIQTRGYFIEYYLDFGNNNLIPALSLAVEKDIYGITTVTAKLENPLSNNIVVKTPLNVVEKVVNTQEFQIIITPDNTVIPTVPTLRQANFSLDVDSMRIGSSDLYNYNQILNLTQSNELQTLLSFISSSNPTINVDYTDYNSFIHFGSAVQQLETFQYKLNLIQTYQSASNSLPNNDLNYILYQNQINELIQGFTGYEEYLYYQSSSYAWPKQNSTLPYINYSTTSSQAINWYNYQQTSASLFDEFNNNNLIYALPQYIQENPTFPNVEPFVYSMGQMFDDIWLYIKAMTDIWKADNALQYGISKDLVGDALQSLGIKLYTDGDQDDLYTWLYGTNQSGSFLFQTASWQTGITASQYTMSGQDEAKSIFKRIYANLPTLLKSKGTDKFINYLTTLYGTPDTILFPMEFGGIDKNSTTPEYIYNKFTYSLKSYPFQYSWVSRNTINTDNSNINCLELRFKPTPYAGIQTILSATDHNIPSYVLWGLTITGSNSGGYDYGIVNLNIKNTSSNDYSTISTINLPLFVTGSDGDTNWWNIKIEQSSSLYTLSVQNEIQGKIGHSSSVSFNSSFVEPLDKSNISYELGNINPLFSSVITSSIFGNGQYYGELQEFRGWLTNLSSSTFNDHTLDPESYVGNTTSSAYNDLLFRFPLGNDLILSTNTTTGSQPNQTYNREINFSGVTQNSYISFTETYYTSPAIGGYSTPNTSKIRIVDQVLATTRLQPLKSVVYPSILPTTTDVNFTQTGFSPQDQINNDIIHQLGTTYNLDDIIGDPRDSDLNFYPGLESLREDYFQKYIASYNYKDFITLMETFHKSLFRYLADYVPGRSNNETGVIIKPHILERNKVRRYEPTIDTASYDGNIYAVTITGSNPGDYCCSRNSPLNEAFIDGEFEGSEIQAWSTYTQNNPFTQAKCDCHLYQINTDETVVWYDCNGELQVDSGVGQRDFQILACSGSVTHYKFFGSPNFFMNDLGRFQDKQAFKEQYEGWDALDNNVDLSIQSQFKFKQLPTSSSIQNKIACVRYKVSNIGGDNKTVYYSYTDCEGNNILCNSSNNSGFPQYNPIETFVYAQENTVEWQDGSIFCGDPNYGPSTYLNIVFDSYITPTFEKIYNYYSQSIEWQDTNLTNTSYIRSRENGVKTTTPDFNQVFPNLSQVSSVNSLNLDKDSQILQYPSLPNVEQTIDYILYVDWSGNTLADRYGSSNYHIKFLVDSSGNTYTPEYTSSYWYNTDQAFGASTPVNISTYDGVGKVNQNYSTVVYQPLKKFQTILYSDTGSHGTNYLFPGYFSPINFKTLDGAVISQLQFTASLNGDIYVGLNENPTKLNFNNIQTQLNGIYNSSKYKITQTPTNQVDIHVVVDGYATFYTISPLTSGTVSVVYNVYLLRNGKKTSLGSASDSKTISFATPLTTYTRSLKKSITINNQNLYAGDEIYVEYNFDGLSNNSAIMRRIGYISDNETIIEIQSNNNLNTDISEVNVPYWHPMLSASVQVRGDINNSQPSDFEIRSNIITGSLNFLNMYGNYQQNPNILGKTLNSGFDSPLLFTIQPKDQIRFGGNESTVYTVVTSSISLVYDGTSNTQTLWIELDKNPLLVDTNYFSIRRLVDDPGFIIIDNNPTQQLGPSPAFIIPKYPTPQLKQNLPNIIQNLASKNLIP